MMQSRRGGLAALAAMLLGLGAPAGAQEASPFLPIDHWAYSALDRLHGLGLLDGFDRASAAVTVAEALDQMERAVGKAAPTTVRLVEGYRDRLVEETGVVETTPGAVRPGGGGTLLSGSALVHGSAILGYGARSGALEPGRGGYRLADWTGPLPIPVTSEPQILAGGGVGLGPVSGRATVQQRGATVSLEEAYGVVTVGPAALWLGRRPWGYRVGLGGGVVLDSVQVDGGGLVMRLRDVPLAGAFRLETTVSRVHNNGWIGQPWLWSMRLALEPHDRFGLGFTRAAMFGGAKNNPITLENTLKVLIGKHAAPGSGFENQLAAIDAWLRIPLSIPTLLRLEWGFEDSGGAITEQPALSAGFEVPAVPGLPELGLALEYTWFAGETIGHWVWYRHWWFHEGWTDGGDNLGHPLGGHGREWRLGGTADVVGARLRLATQLFLRDRGEFNLYAPDREGRSGGILTEIDWRITRHLELTGAVSWEESRKGWRERSGRVGIRWVGGV